MNVGVGRTPPGGTAETRKPSTGSGTMSTRSVTHATFTIEREYCARPERAYDAWADPAVKRRWFVGPDDWGTRSFELDFRVGGEETSSGGPKDGLRHSYAARYLDVVPNERIIMAYDMHLGSTRISVSLATVELKPLENRTRLVFTEQGAFLDGHDDPGERERGTRLLLDALAAELRLNPE
jgi:uncharacterized protein YndB with AHSA1/START domain